MVSLPLILFAINLAYKQTLNTYMEKQVCSTGVLSHCANSCLPERMTACPDQKVQCPGTSQCMDAWEPCDVYEDCEDGSNKAHCSQSHCLAGQWQCQNKLCVMDSWKCDGIDHCGDSSDEEACGESDCTACILRASWTTGVALCKMHLISCNRNCPPRF